LTAPASRDKTRRLAVNIAKLPDPRQVDVTARELFTAIRLK
jgi:hypothetical protein